MYNYVMLMGVVDGYFCGQTVTIKLRVDEPFGKESNVFDVKVVDPLADMIKGKLSIGRKITIKGRLKQTNNDYGTKIEIIAERIMF